MSKEIICANIFSRFTPQPFIIVTIFPVTLARPLWKSCIRPYLCTYDYSLAFWIYLWSVKSLDCMQSHLPCWSVRARGGRLYSFPPWDPLRGLHSPAEKCLFCANTCRLSTTEGSDPANCGSLNVGTWKRLDVEPNLRGGENPPFSQEARRGLWRARARGTQKDGESCWTTKKAWRISCLLQIWSVFAF